MAAVLIVAVVMVFNRGGSERAAAQRWPDSPRATTELASAVAGSARSRALSVRLVRWHGPVEHLFFHTLIIRPRLAFRHDALGRGLRDYFVTTREFRSILRRMYANGWTLVDLHRAIDGRVRVPRGRRPFVLSEDDVNYYDYQRGRGLGRRLVLDVAGNVAIEEQGGARPRRVSGNDLVPIVDAFVARHPAFSAQGAKGVLALTGYEGLFGERIQRRGPGRLSALGRAKALAGRLRATGWTFASHTYGHIDLSRASTAAVARDSVRWARLARAVIGHTDVLVYPFGARPPIGSPAARVLRQAGFVIQCDINTVARLVRRNGVSIMSRRHIDGLALYGQPNALRPFFSAPLVRDTHARR
jgi:hypothetical protein